MATKYSADSSVKRIINKGYILGLYCISYCQIDTSCNAPAFHLAFIHFCIVIFRCTAFHSLCIFQIKDGIINTTFHILQNYTAKIFCSILLDL